MNQYNNNRFANGQFNFNNEGDLDNLCCYEQQFYCR
ncbi:unnamed protein product, partial [Rotaria magnacalcarata]